MKKNKYLIRVSDLQPEMLPKPQKKKVEIIFVELPVIDWVEIC